ncbi:MAG: hypothetical protein SGJ11_02435 [Phycisphaerae bacterium]|nr:hypothetical protein [Phycisphaerae bacterium]
MLQFDFENGNSYLYTVYWNGEQTGEDLFSVVAAAQPETFMFEVIEFSFGNQLVGVGIGSDYNFGVGTKPLYLDFWHYWRRDSSDQAWAQPAMGFSDRIVTDGSWDGWVFGSNGVPAAVPAPSVLAAAMLYIAGARRRRG